MNAENFEYLTSEVLPRLGFSQVLDDELLKKMKIGGETIHLKAQGNFGKDTMQYEFRLEQKDNRYYLNAIEATITKENEQSQTHVFGLYAQKGYNADEMYNMMDGRFVYREFMKEGEKVGRWSTIDLKRKDDDGNSILRSYYDNNTNFNLVVELGKLPLNGLSRQDKESLVNEMKQGNPGVAGIRKPDGSKERAYLIARPNIGTIELRNKDGERINLDQKKIQGQDNKKFEVIGEGKPPKISGSMEKMLEKTQNPEASLAPGAQNKMR